VSLHDFDLALRHCDRIVGLRGGRVLFDLPPGEASEDLRRQLYELEPTR
jgi:phosphonate transport system ATP-binding protein